MAKQTINLGTAANDGTGDNLRAGGTKINENFTEVYAAAAAAQEAADDAGTAAGAAASAASAAAAAAEDAQEAADAAQTTASGAATAATTALTAANEADDTADTAAAAAAAAQATADTALARHSLTQTKFIDVPTASLGAVFTDIPGLTFDLEANKKYEFSAVIQAYTDQTTTGIDVAVNGPANFVRLSYSQPRYGATGVVKSIATAYDNNTASGTGPSVGTPGRLFEMDGKIQTGDTAGILAFRIKRENVGTGPVVEPGSWATVKEVFTWGT
jgi:hypothetical protein